MNPRSQKVPCLSEDSKGTELNANVGVTYCGLALSGVPTWSLGTSTSGQKSQQSRVISIKQIHLTCCSQCDLLPLISILREAAAVANWRACGMQSTLKNNTFEEYIMTWKHPHLMLGKKQGYNTPYESLFLMSGEGKIREKPVVSRGWGW